MILLQSSGLYSLASNTAFMTWCDWALLIVADTESCCDQAYDSIMQEIACISNMPHATQNLYQHSLFHKQVEVWLYPLFRVPNPTGTNHS